MDGDCRRCCRRNWLRGITAVASGNELADGNADKAGRQVRGGSPKSWLVSFSLN